MLQKSIIKIVLSLITFTIKSKSKLLACFYFLLIIFFSSCKNTNSGFIKESNLTHHNLEVRYSELKSSDLLPPRIRLFVIHPNEKEAKELNFVIDTGSNISLVRKNIFIQPGIQKTFKLKSISGEINKEFIELRLSLLDEKKRLISENSIFHSIELDSKFNFDGIIGNDILAEFNLFLELPEKIFLITPFQEKKNLSGFRKIPFIFIEGHIIIEAKLGQMPCRLLIDTGAGISYLNQKKAKELELKIAGNASFIDLGGRPQETIYHIGENLCVDENICQKNIELLSGNSIEDFLSEDGKLDGILGLNWIEKYSILIDYHNLNLYIKQR